MFLGPHQRLEPVFTGKPLEEAKAAMILVHGRGATANSILELAHVLDHPDFCYIAPPAANNSWYPFRFLAPLENNEPGLSSGLQAIADLISRIIEAGIPPKHIVLAGFSQGACLASEYVARHAQRFGGLLVFSGGLIGPPGTARHYSGSLEGTPVFLGCGDRDSHIPAERVKESATVFTDLGAEVIQKLYPEMGHTINQDEIVHAQKIIRGVLQN